MRPSLISLGVALSMAPPLAALAQGDYRAPETSRAERQVRELNRDMSRQIETQQQNQHNQLEFDQLRMRQQQQELRTSVPPPGTLRSTCPAGSIGC